MKRSFSLKTGNSLWLSLIMRKFIARAILSAGLSLQTYSFLTVILLY